VGLLGGALVGGLFFYWIAGPRVLSPGQFEWLMKLDWRINFLGWHLFRNDPWRLPPGVIEGYLAGEGTTIGFTDSVPLAALALKPFDVWLPTPFQYFGLWLLLCFVLQGVFGALIARVFTRSVVAQILAAALFVLLPTLLIRVGHPALSAHFVLLWALWIYCAGGRDQSARRSSQIALGAIVGLIHPYLAAMTLALLAAVPLRERTLQSALACAAAVTATIAAWWFAGFISVSNTTDLSAGGLGLYSMNMLSPITPRGWSTLLPEWPVATEMQAYEGFQYLGVGTLALLLLAIALLLVRRRSLPWAFITPLALVCLGGALYALSPRVTIGSAVIVDWTSPELDRLAFFRASGRFFWPMTYLLLTGSIAAVVTRLRTRAAVVLLLLAVVLQFVDQRSAHAERRATSRSDAFHHWPRQLVSPAWHDILPHYRRLLLVPASQCGGAPLEHEELAYLAGLHGLTINSGLGARWDETARRRYCGSLEATMGEARLDDQSLYVVSRQHEERLRTQAATPIVCGGLDVARICVTRTSSERWAGVVTLRD
jgi:hypothetical protein